MPGSRSTPLRVAIALVAWAGVLLQLVLSLQLALNSLARGAWLQAYPYPFIDVAALGYGRVALNALGLMLVFIVIAWTLVGLQRSVRRTA